VRNLPKNLGILLLAVWLILTGLIAVLKFSFDGLPLVMGLLAIAAGVLICSNEHEYNGTTPNSWLQATVGRGYMQHLQGGSSWVSYLGSS